MELELIRQVDPEVAEAIDLELNRQRTHVELIASENFVSPAVMAAMGTCLTNKYAEGYPGKRYYGGCEFVDIIEDLARKRACQLFGADRRPSCGGTGPGFLPRDGRARGCFCRARSGCRGTRASHPCSARPHRPGRGGSTPRRFRSTCHNNQRRRIPRRSSGNRASGYPA